MDAKSISASHTTLSQMMEPQDANGHGNVHGGVIMKLVDEAGALAAMRHAQNSVVTVAMSSMIFKEPIRLGYVVILEAELTYVGRTSMEVKVEVTSENPVTGKSSHTNSAYVVYVAIDGTGKPIEVPPLHLETDAQRLRWDAAKERQKFRKQQQEQEDAIKE